MSALKVCKSHRSYNKKNRILPGTIFEYEGKRYVLGGQKNNGAYFYPYGENPDKTHFQVKKCIILKQSGGLVFLD